MKEKDNKSKYVNVIINIILVGIIISLFIDKNIIIGKEKQVIKEMTQSTLESDLNNTITELNANQEKYAANVDAYKKKITEAITNQGVTTEISATADVVAENIGKIISTKTTATATAAQILTGKTAWVNGTKITGTMANNGAVTKTISAGGSYTIPAGYHNGSGKVTATALKDQTSGTATAAQILTGKTAYVNGALVTGTMANKGAVTSTLNAGGSYTIPAGYHNGSGKVTANSLASQTSATATAAQILTGKTAYVNGSKVTGTMASKGTLNWKPTTSTTATVAAGYYSGGTLDSSAAYNAGYTAGKSATQIVNLGSGTSFDVTSYSGYQNFTTSNFITCITNVKVTKNTYGEAKSLNQSITPTKSYNSSTGTYTVSFPSVTMSGAGGRTDYCGMSFSGNTYLIY